MTAPNADSRVERLLRDAAAAASWLATPDLRGVVMDRIARERLRPGLARDGLDRPRRGLRVVRALAIAAVALLLVAGAAAALGYRLPGLDLLFVDRLPPAGTGLDLGSPMSLGEARGLEAPRVLVPSSRPAPETAYRLGAGDRTIVTLAYRAAAGAPALKGSDLALTVIAVPGDVEDQLITKLLGPGTTIEPVTVDGSRGWWITGAPHEILIMRPDRQAGVLWSALAGDTLVFAREGTLYRLESALGRDATIGIAASMR